MIRVLLAFLLLVWAGAALLLGELRWFRRPRLIDRLRPHPLATRVGSGHRAGPGTPRAPTAPALPFVHRLSGAHDVVMAWHSSLAPVAERSGDRLAIAFGVTEPLTTRLARIHSPLEARDFRMAQVAWSLAAGAGTALVTIILGTAPVLTLAASIAATLVSFLSIEQRLATRSETWQRRIFLELPVVSEQLGMLLSAGHSLGQALTRIARRSDAAISRDLSVVVGRLQQGVEEAAALREWSELAGVPALDRLLSVLALNREATDLGSLITEEARATRAEVHRELIEQLERRAQQVWIPVTVATLIPGVLFLAVPFLEALRLFSST